MHLIKHKDLYMTFYKKKLKDILYPLKKINICVLDFESFQFFNNKIINKNILSDVPFSVSIGIISYDQKNDKFILNNKVHNKLYKSFNDITDLKNELLNLAIFINDILFNNKIDKIVVMAKKNEVNVFKYFTSEFKNIINNFVLDKYLKKSGFVDIYNFYKNKNHFNIISYSFKLNIFLNSIMQKYNDILSNDEIGKLARKHFNNLNKPKITDEQFNQIKKHNDNDIYKAKELLNFMIYLDNIKENDILNYNQLYLKETDIIGI